MLALLEKSAEPLSVGQVAVDLGVHKNSARFHLDALVDVGYARRAAAAPKTQGRPPLLYSATSEAPSMGNVHLLELVNLLLTEVLAESEDSASIGERAGRRWGAALADPTTPADRVTDDLTTHLAERGFGIRREGEDLCFTRCPFRNAIDPARLPIVCAIHQGLLDGYMDASAGTWVADPITIGPQVCVTRFHTAAV